jgi:hypothetical protein
MPPAGFEPTENIALSVIIPSFLILTMEIIDICCERCTKNIYRVGKMERVLIVQLAVHTVTI